MYSAVTDFCAVDGVYGVGHIIYIRRGVFAVYNYESSVSGGYKGFGFFLCFFQCELAAFLSAVFFLKEQ